MKMAAAENFGSSACNSLKEFAGALVNAHDTGRTQECLSRNVIRQARQEGPKSVGSESHNVSVLMRCISDMMII
jgi:hypothetical protein